MLINGPKRIVEQVSALLQSQRSAVERSIINIAILEDDPLRLVGFQSILDLISDFHVTGTSVADVVANQDVHLAVLGNHSGVMFRETMSTLKSARPDLRVIVTGTGMDEQTILTAIDSGAQGYIDEAESTRDLVQAQPGRTGRSEFSWVSRNGPSNRMWRS
jgi:DNA-binding NarL/FixJ family response regulator